MSERPMTYSQVWDQYAAGQVSTSVMRQLLRDDEVFRQWCVRRAEAERKQRDSVADIKARAMISDEDMA